ncbi:MAG: DUF2974 domain-containing protein [Bacilli bacterium]|nr:DUF2974 domain-containing protein [Bacilli bacterium]
MKNIFNYISNYGNLSFLQVPFNDVDNLIFSSLVYVDFSTDTDVNNLTINKISEIYFKNHTNSQIIKNIIAVKTGIKVLNLIKDTVRYKDLVISNYEYVSSNDTQFCAMIIKINEDTNYIAFEGTDHLISGWKEDFELAYKFPVKAQELAIDYLNKNIKLSSKNIIVGGHSKGGNLALVASMYCKFWKRKKIIKIYNNDGPGLRKEQIGSKQYRIIEKRLMHIIPNYSFIGLLLRHGNNYKVVYSYEKGLFAHNLANWKVEGTKLVSAKLSFLSQELDHGIIKWLDKYNDEERKNFVEALFDICNRAGINNLLDYKDDKFNSTIKFIKETKNLDSNTKSMIIDLFKFLIKYCTNDFKNNLFTKNRED